MFKDIETLSKNIARVKGYEWQLSSKPIERLMQPQTLFQFPSFMEKTEDSLLLADTHHNRVLHLQGSGAVTSSVS